VSHFRAFGCRCFILKKGRLDKFESRSSDGIFLGYASHSRAYLVLNLDTNLVMETCEVTFDETQPCNSSVFECASDDEVGKKIFEDEEDDAGEDDGDDGEALATHVPSTSTTTTTVQDGPSPTPPTIQEDQVEATAEGEVAVGVLDRQTYQGDTRGSRLCGEDRDRETENSKVCARTRDTRFIQVQTAKVGSSTSCLGDQVWPPTLVLVEIRSGARLGTRPSFI
jgi:hypothetical protein